MTEERKSPSLGSTVFGGMPDRKRKLKIWAIRSVIVVLAAYAIVAMNGPAWLIWVAWAYVALTLVTAFLLTRGAGATKAD